MEASTSRPWLANLRRNLATTGAVPTSDRALLQDFVRARDEAAFTALVRRHGPMVMAVCRRILGQHADAEDAFQAVFLLLARKAGQISRPELVANWLYGVAQRTAWEARRRLRRRQAREKTLDDPLRSSAADAIEKQELFALLDREVARLTEKYRLPVVLCELQGRSRREVAELLGIPEGTLSSRLAAAKQQLAVRLTRKGVAVSAAGIAGFWSESTATAAITPALLKTTVSSVFSGHVTPAALQITQGVLTMFWCKKVMALVVVSAGVGLGVGAIGHQWIGHGKTFAREHPNVRRISAVSPGESPRTRQPIPPKAPDEKEEQAARMRRANNLKQIGLAMHNYHDTYGSFPAEAIYSQDGKPLLSWRVAILPFLEEENLYNQFKLDEPWDSVHNKKLLGRMPKVFGEHGTQTHFRIFTGEGMIFHGDKGSRFAHITDGMSNTIMVVEAANSVPWTKPDELLYDPNKPLPKLGGTPSKDGFYVLMCDGSVQFVRTPIKEQQFRALLTPAGGEVIEPPDDR
jgi:RNA polymerase sigma factor (sigma-70 family)